MATVEPMGFNQESQEQHKAAASNQDQSAQQPLSREQDQSPNPKATFYPDKKAAPMGKVSLTLLMDYEGNKKGGTISVEEGSAQALVNQGIAKRSS